MPTSKRQLSREDWAGEALQVLAEGGVAAVAVEPIAVRLGTTKGSFYWHFADRGALVTAALALWEERGTEAVITELQTLSDPAERLRKLFDQVFRAGPMAHVDLALMSEASDPRVADALARVTTRRVNYLTELFAELGHPPADARDRALLGYTTFVGLIHSLRASGGQLLDDQGARDAYLEFLFGVLLRA